MHHSVPEQSELFFTLRFTLQTLSASSIFVKASHYKVLLRQSTTGYFPYLPLSANTLSLRLLPSQRSFLSQGKKIDQFFFLQLSGGGEEVLCASHGWLCCQLEGTAVDSRSHRGCWIRLTMALELYLCSITIKISVETSDKRPACVSKCIFS